MYIVVLIDFNYFPCYGSLDPSLGEQPSLFEILKLASHAPTSLASSSLHTRARPPTVASAQGRQVANRMSLLQCPRGT